MAGRALPSFLWLGLRLAVFSTGWLGVDGDAACGIELVSEVAATGAFGWCDLGEAPSQVDERVLSNSGGLVRTCL